MDEKRNEQRNRITKADKDPSGVKSKPGPPSYDGVFDGCGSCLLIMTKDLHIRNLHCTLGTELNTAIAGYAFIANVKFRLQGEGLGWAIEGTITAIYTFFLIP